jgi:NADPH-dependent 2,4-dienoyl-CoA reductase/sulfur reductase-like enzyme
MDCINDARVAFVERTGFDDGFIALIMPANNRQCPASAGPRRKIRTSAARPRKTGFDCGGTLRDMTQHVLIVGGGIAGPALAIALRQAGIDSIVYEASDRPRDSAGAFLNVAPNGLSVLRALGLGRRLDGLGFQNDRLIFHNETGRVLADVPVGGVTIERGALSRMLREAAEDAGVRVEIRQVAFIDRRARRTHRRAVCRWQRR